MAARILMCRPDHFGIEYEINPWMSRRRAADRRRAMQQWQRLVELLGSLGASIELIEPVAGLPDMVFTANAGLVYKDRVLLSRFRYDVRQPEAEQFARWFREHGFQVVELPEGHYFEGAGDALFCGETLIGGYLFRSDVRSHHWVAEQLGCPLVVAELINPYFYHLDTCFCPLRPGCAVWYPEAFDRYGRLAIEQAVPELIEVNQEEAYRFACNSVVVGEHVITPTGCPRLHRTLRLYGFEPHEVELTEFQKAGGSAKCLTLRLDGEDAAAWRTA